MASDHALKLAWAGNGIVAESQNTDQNTNSPIDLAGLALLDSIDRLEAIGNAKLLVKEIGNDPDVVADE